VSVALAGLALPAFVGSAAAAPRPRPATHPTERPKPPGAAAQSPNWSGYVVSSSSTPITQVSGAWTLPTLDCSVTPNAGASTWVGIGGSTLPNGSSSGVLLQTGVSTDCVGGVQENHGWWEEVPSDPNHEVGFAGFAISTGDSIQASVYEGSDGTWETKVDDLTTGLSGVMAIGEGWGVSTDAGDGTFPIQGRMPSLSYAGGYTADWIVEDYAEGNGSAMVPLADYGTVGFTNLTTSLATWFLTTGEGEVMVQNGVTFSTPSPPSNGGFSVSYAG
jgi:hypothetical protein